MHVTSKRKSIQSGLKAKGLNNPARMLVAKFVRRFTLARCLEMINATCAINAHAITRDRRRQRANEQAGELRREYRMHAIRLDGRNNGERRLHTSKIGNNGIGSQNPRGDQNFLDDRFSDSVHVDRLNRFSVCLAIERSTRSIRSAIRSTVIGCIGLTNFGS